MTEKTGRLSGRCWEVGGGFREAFGSFLEGTLTVHILRSVECWLGRRSCLANLQIEHWRRYAHAAVYLFVIAALLIRDYEAYAYAAVREFNPIQG